MHKERKQKKRLQGQQEGATGSYCLMGTELHLGKMKSSGDGWWLHNSAYVLTPLNCVLMVKMVDFTLSIFYHNFKKECSAKPKRCHF